MAPRTDRTKRIPSGVASPVTTSHAAKGSVFVNLRNGGNLQEKMVTLLEKDEGPSGHFFRSCKVNPTPCTLNPEP